MFSWKKNIVSREEVDVFDMELTEYQLLEKGYIKGINYQNIDCTEHYYKIKGDLSSSNYHLHWYKRLVTGTSLLKEYDFTELYLEARSANISEKSIFDFIVIVRFFIKFNLFFGVVRYVRDRKVLKSDFIESLNSIRGDKVACCFFESRLNISIKEFDEVINLSIIKQYLISLNCKAKLKSYKRLSVFDFLYLYPKTLLKSVFYKFLNLRKRLGRPFYIAIVGTDGSGKSTVVSGLKVRLRGFSPKVLHYGLPNNTLFDRLKNKYLFSVSKNNSKNDLMSNSALSNELSFIKRMYYLDLAVRRLRTTLYGRVLSYFGRSIIFDRYYNISEETKIDNRNIPARYFITFNIERFLYFFTPSVEVCFFLKPPLDYVIKRNKERIKDCKETTEEIKKRYSDVEHLEIKSKTVIQFENTGTINEAIDFIIDNTLEIRL